MQCQIPLLRLFSGLPWSGVEVPVWVLSMGNIYTIVREKPTQNKLLILLQVDNFFLILGEWVNNFLKTFKIENILNKSPSLSIYVFIYILKAW